MKTTSVHYSKVFNLGDYQNEKIGVDIEIEAGDQVQDVINKAKDFVENQHQLAKQKIKYLEMCERLSNPDDFTGTQLKVAQGFKEQYESMLTNTPKLLS